MIKSNRYLIIASTIGIIAIVCLMLLYRQLALSSLVEHETRANVALTQVLSKIIWTRYQELTSENTASMRAPGKEHPPIRQLDAEVKQLMRDSKLVKVKIFNLDGLTLFSTDLSQINQDMHDNSGFRSARAGKPASSFVYRDQFDAFEGSVSNINVVSSHVPITGRTDNEIEAVIEVYSDVTDLIVQIQRMQWYIFFGVLGSVAILYLLLIGTSRRADQIEAAHFEESSLSQAHIHYQTYHHAITDLPNRLNFTERLEQAVSLALRCETLLSVILIDIDRFKLVNDSFGLSSGDALLRLIGDRLSNCMRVSDSLFHMGGDEFTVLMENLKDSDSPARLAKRIAESMKAPFIINDQAIIISLSMGIAILEEGTSATMLAKNAEAAMYLVKADSGNQIRYYTPELDRHAQDQLILETALQQALPREEFVLHYQPRLAADESSLVGFEALIRWQRDDGSMVPPNDFIPALELTGLIRDVGQWVLGQACWQCRAWQDAGYDPVRISVNVSPLQFRESDFVEAVKSILEETGLDAKHLELELTESALIDNPQAAIVTMETLRGMDITLSLDDFGTGYSSFSYLRNLPVDFLKIDRCFVNEIAQSSRDAAIVSAISSLAHNLDIGLVAEGVESPEQAKKLILVGCHELQGYLYSKPVSAIDAGKWLTRSNRMSSGQN
ncbi:MAG: bifunctional diguanylate cyclase/phosphodiesterase [Gammaproteobacteria bacterium]|nr:bifunctional diguanylate cyclase/phosphodiesterase [Gammaproteobacteria bacterium]